MDQDRDQELPGDLSALAWVQDELRRTLDNAHKALRRHLRALESPAEAGASGASTALVQARNLIHQGVGALSLIGMQAPARLLDGSEQAIQRLIVGGVPCDLDAVAKIERASFALLDFMRRSLAGKPLSPMALFPQYRAVLQLAGVERIHPADLWLSPESEAALHHASASAQAPVAADAKVRQVIETQLLKYFRTGDEAAARRISQQFKSLAQAGDGSSAGLWPLAAAFFEAQSAGLLPTDNYSKRMASRLLAQVRAAERGLTDVPERLLRDLLFFCARATRDARLAPQLERVCTDHGLVAQAPIDYEQSSLGRYDPALVPVARRRVSSLKETWTSVAAGDLAALPGIPEQAGLVAESVQQLYPEGQRLAASLQSALGNAVRQGQTPSAELALEVATTLLCLDASLDELDPDQPELQSRIQRLAERLDTVSLGRPAPPLEPWVEDLYRDVSDRQSMGSVVQELRASLAEVEQQLDQFTRQPASREPLIPVPTELAAMRGVLSVLGLDQAAQAVQRMREDVLAVLDRDADGASLSEQIADNLGALSFLIDMLAVQPQLAKSLFRFDPLSGRFSAVMGRAQAAAPRQDVVESRLLDQVQVLARDAEQAHMSSEDLSSSLAGLADQATAADQPDLAHAAAQARQGLERAQDSEQLEAARTDAAQALANFANTTQAVPKFALPELEDEPDDMREVFIEEAREVIEQGREALARLDLDPQELEAMTALRRAFHTLKGSSRMVGLKTFGEAAWACEQLFNARLADAVVEAQTPLRNFTGMALEELSQWVDQIAAGSDAALTGQALMSQAEALRLAPVMPWSSPESEPAAAEAEPQALPIIDAADELDIQLPQDDELQLPDLGLDDELAASVALPLLDQAAPVAVADVAADMAPLVLDVELDSGASATLSAIDADLPLPELAEIVVASDWRETSHQPGAELAQPEIDLELDLAALDEAPVGLSSEPSAELDAAVAVPAPEEWPTLSPEAPSDEPAEPVETIELADTPTLDTVPGALDLAPESAAQADIVLTAAGPEPMQEPQQAAGLASQAEVDDAERYKVVGPLRIQIALFNIFLNEADEQSRRLLVELQEWQHELQRPVGDLAIALAHSLAGNSATVGYQELSALSRRLEHALERSSSRGGGQFDEVLLYLDVAEEIRRLLHQFAAGFVKPVAHELLMRLELHEQSESALGNHHDRPDFDDAPVTMMSPLNPLGGLRFSSLENEISDDVPQPVAVSRPVSAQGEDLRSTQVHGLGEDLESSDAIDPELWEIFVEEGRELLPELGEQLRQWEIEPTELGAGVAAMRALHTFKGGARLAGAMRLGELAHRLETAIEQLTLRGVTDASVLAQLHVGVDVLADEFNRLSGSRIEMASSVGFDEPVPNLAAAIDALASVDVALATAAVRSPGAASLADVAAEPAESSPLQSAGWAPGLSEAMPEQSAGQVDWSRVASGRQPGAAVAAISDSVAAGSVRVRAPLLDRMVSHAGEVGIARARMESDMVQMQTALKELTENLERLRRQLRDVELQAETQMASRLEAARHSQQAFDPLEMDRFTRVQELTRMMAESVNDVGTVQRGLQQTLQDTEDQLAVQARLTRDLQDDLLRARMVEFDTLSDRLYRVVRQASKESGKQVRLNLIGGGIELDRAVLDRMAPPFEHLLRNAVVHGIETPGLREATGKAASGNIEVSLRQAGNEVLIEVRDDGAGLDLARIAERARAMGLLDDESRPTEAELAGLIFTPGFSTADEVTELAGRGIGMDVVRAEVTAMGGRIETASTSGQGTAFRMVLPLTTAVTQVVLLQCGALQVAVPSTLVELVRRVPAAEVEAAYASGVIRRGDEDIPFFWLGGLLQQSLRGPIDAKTLSVVVVRSASQWVALHVSQVIGNQEVVVKNLGPQLSRLPGLAGMSLLATGGTVLIYNPVALAAVYGEDIRRRLANVPVEQHQVDVPVLVEPVRQAPLVMVVDDSLTVRRVTQRLLQREGYRVVLAKDGLDALERLADETPAVMLCDIEMPRMDGFDLVRNVRNDPRLVNLPVVMITSRIAEKHQEHARDLGVNNYLGKPYDEDLLLSLVRGYAGEAVVT